MSRITENFNLYWKFHRNEVVGEGSYRGLDDSNWRDVTLPHDWSVEEPFSKENASGTGYLPGGVGWYRKHFLLGEELENKKVFIAFDGVYNNSHVWCNTNNVGKRPYGYSAFTYDITPFVEFGDRDNVIAVKVNHKDIADSRWFTGSGIYRDVTLTICDKLHIPQYGVFLTTTKVDKSKATINIEVDVRNDSDLQRNIVVQTIVKDYNGVVVATASNDVEVLSSADKKTVLQALVESPNLWSPNNPYLYTLETRIVENGVCIDEVKTTFGIREFTIDAEKGFFLNGKSMKLKGVCVHHDAGCLGAAVPKKVWEKRLYTLKDMGCNAIRMSHNPPSAVLLDACDEIGFLVMDEAFDEWEGLKNKWWQGHNVYPPKHFGYADDFPQWSERDIKDMVLRDRNHPSIIMWSIGNEIDYPNDPYCHPSFKTMTGNNDNNKPDAERMYDPNKPNAERLAQVAKTLTKYVKQCDTTRPVTAALAFPELSNNIGFPEELDVVGYNYKEHLYEDDHRKYPGRVIYGSENGASYSNWLAVKDNDYICGQFIWTGIDYLGEAHGWPIRVANPGFLDLSGYPKPKYYYHKSLWKDEPMIYLSTIPEKDEDDILHWQRELPSWNFRDDQVVEVVCYTNCDSVKLYLNEKLLGEATPASHNEHIVTCKVTFSKGCLKAVGLNGGLKVCEYELNTPKSPYKINAVADCDTLKSDGQDVMQIEVTLVDGDGVMVHNSDYRVEVDIQGPARLLGIENSKPDDMTPYRERWRNTYHGRLVVYLASLDESGEVDVTFSAKGLLVQSVRIISS